MNTRRLRLLVELSRLGSMGEVAAELHTTTSNVSQGIAALARDVGAPLIERDGRRVRLTPAASRLAEHAVTILAAVDVAYRDLDPHAEPHGVLRVAGFATAIRRSLLPVVDAVAVDHPGVEVRVLEHEPPEALDLLVRDDVDLALVYDYDLAPATWPDHLAVFRLWRTEWGIGVPSGTRQHGLGDFCDRDWVVNSRNHADEDALRTLASMSGFDARITHRIDSLELVEDLIVAGRGIALLPMHRACREGIALIPLHEPRLHLQAYAAIRRGRDRWVPLRVVVDHLVHAAASIDELADR